MTNGAAYENLRHLCSFGPRLSGSAGAENAVQLTQKMLRDAGADTTWLQPCKVTHWVRGTRKKDIWKHPMASGMSLGSQLWAIRWAAVIKPVCAELVEVTSFSQLKELGKKSYVAGLFF